MDQIALFIITLVSLYRCLSTSLDKAKNPFDFGYQISLTGCPFNRVVSVSKVFTQIMYSLLLMVLYYLVFVDGATIGGTWVAIIGFTILLAMLCLIF